MRSLRDCIWHQSTNNEKNAEDLEVEEEDDDEISCGSVKGARNYAGMAAAACANTLMAQQSALLKQLRGKTREEARAEAERAKVIDRREGHVRKPKKDRNNYRYIQLENGIRLLLISTLSEREEIDSHLNSTESSSSSAPSSTSPTTSTPSSPSSMSAAALNVKVGSFHDPAHLQGLAHLCEHVLFTGSEAYPTESFSGFLGERGGSSNAYTASEHTNFHFDVPSPYFEETIKHFVSFFECPLFREVSVLNEVEMVQSEHEKNRLNDVWRTNQVERATANPAHVFSRFSTGTRRTLLDDPSAAPDRNLKYELFSFYKTNYSANLMTACLVHRAPLDELERIAKENFLKLKNKNIPETLWPSRAFRSAQLRTRIFVVPVKDIYHVNLTFQIEDLRNEYRAGAEGYLAQMIGHKGPGGLFAHLRKLGWAHHLVCGWKALARGLAFFMVTVQLTEAGERHTDEVVKQVFQYIQLVKESGPQRWFFDEISFLSEQQFESKDAERAQNLARDVASWLHTYSPEDVLSGEYVISEWRPDLVRRVLRHLNPDQVRITVLTKNCRFFASEVEEHFGTEFSVEKISDETIKQWRNCGINEHHSLPTPNELIDRVGALIENPLDNGSPPIVTLVPVAGSRRRRTRRDNKTSSKMLDHQGLAQDASGNGKVKRKKKEVVPELVLMLERIRMRMWHLPATQFRVAKSYLYVHFSLPSVITRDPLSCAANSILAFVVKDAFTEYAYCGELAGIFYSLKPIKTGLELSIRGYSQNQKIFLENLLDKFYSHNFDEDDFNRVYDQHKKGIRSAEADSLKMQVRHLLSTVLCPRSFSRPSRLAALSSLTFEDVVTHADIFRAACHVEALCYGNVDRTQANAIAEVLIEKRKEYLEKLAFRLEVAVKTNPHLEDWFLRDPIERIVALEDALSVMGKKNNNNNENSNGVVGNGKLVANINHHEKQEEQQQEQQDEQEIHIGDADLDENEENDEEEQEHAEIVEEKPLLPPETLYNQDLELPLTTGELGHVLLVHNEVHSSSCVMHYLQCGQNCPKNSALLELFCALCRSRLVSAMRHEVALGYVVDVDIRKNSSSLGLRTVVESQYPLSLVHDTIEGCLDKMEAYLNDEVTEEVMEAGKRAVVAQRQEERGRMKEAGWEVWKEILQQTYHFYRQDEELEELSKLTKSDVIRFYKFHLRRCGIERRNLVVSVGPDPILNRIEGTECANFNSESVLALQTRCKPLPVLKEDEISDWCRKVFKQGSEENTASGGELDSSEFEPPRPKQDS